jgi:hypothetical protein
MPSLGARERLVPLASTEQAETICSTHDITAVTAHATPAIVQHYTWSTNQEKLAQAAIMRPQDASGKRADKPLKWLNHDVCA